MHRCPDFFCAFIDIMLRLVELIKYLDVILQVTASVEHNGIIIKVTVKHYSRGDGWCIIETSAGGLSFNPSGVI